MSKPTIHLRTRHDGVPGALYADSGESRTLTCHLTGQYHAHPDVPVGPSREALPEFTRLANLHGWEVRVHDSAYTQVPSTVERVSAMSDQQIVEAIEAGHPATVECPEPELKQILQADGLAMRLIHGRHDKRVIVNLIRWCLLGCPTSPKKS